MSEKNNAVGHPILGAPPNRHVPSAIQTAEVEVPCTNLATSLDFFTTRVGFRVDLIFPADAPTTAVISAYGVRLRLITAQPLTPLRLCLCIDTAAWPNFVPHELTGPDDVVIALVDAEPKITIPMYAGMDYQP